MAINGLPMMDFHVDAFAKVSLMGMDFFGGDEALHVDLPKMQVAGMDGAYFSIWPNPALSGRAATDAALSQLRDIHVRFGAHPQKFRLASTGQEIVQNAQAGIKSYLVSVEGGQVLNDDPRVVTQLRQLGVSKLTLTHFKGTSWASSDREEDTGLTDLGREIVRELNRQRIMVDVAHGSPQTILDAIAVSTSPVVFSHGGVQAANPGSTRCISDAVIRAIASAGGVIGISFFPDHLMMDIDIDSIAVGRFWQTYENYIQRTDLTEEEQHREATRLLLMQHPLPNSLPSFELIFRHIDHVVKLVGADHVAIGSDYDGVPYICKGVEDVSRLGNLVNLMRERGYSETEIAKIMGGNILRVFEQL